MVAFWTDSVDPPNESGSADTDIVSIEICAPSQGQDEIALHTGLAHTGQFFDLSNRTKRGVPVWEIFDRETLAKIPGAAASALHHGHDDHAKAQADARSEAFANKRKQSHSNRMLASARDLVLAAEEPAKKMEFDQVTFANPVTITNPDPQGQMSSNPVENVESSERNLLLEYEDKSTEELEQIADLKDIDTSHVWMKVLAEQEYRSQLILDIEKVVTAEAEEEIDNDEMRGTVPRSLDGVIIHEHTFTLQDWKVKEAVAKDDKHAPDGASTQAMHAQCRPG